MIPNLDELADRHFRPDPSGLLAAATSARQARVLVSIGAPMAGTKAGQDALWMLANMLCRQFKLVTGIGLDVPPEIDLLPRVAAFGEARSLKDAIANCVRLVAGEHVTLSEFVASESDAYQIEIFVGRPPAAPRAPIRLILFADGWRLFLGSSLPPTELPRSGVTLGPYLAACFAAGEVFKQLRGMKEGKGQFIGEKQELYLSLWSTQTASSWDGLSRDPDMGAIELPPLYFAGAGAVAEAAALTIAGLPDATGYMTAVDPDSLDLSNDNRYALATLGDDRKPKAPLMEGLFERRGFGHFAHPGTWQDYVGRQGREPNRPDLAALENRFRYNLVLSCVDDNGARHAIQNLWPEMIIGGSTHGLTAKAITYDMAGTQLCLKCFNPVVERNELVRKRIEKARALDPDERVRFFGRLGIDPAKAAEHLRNPRCGQLSEQDLDRFASGEPMMSVGFVSVAAGVLLAAQLLRLVHSGREGLAARGSTLVTNFYRPGLRWLQSLPEVGCDCIERRGSDWSRKWRVGAWQRLEYAHLLADCRDGIG